ncbi:MAG: SagB/ThcOx family dehydrogenase [Mariprofundaceae bacterium]
MTDDALAGVLAYHDATKHHFHAAAKGPGFLDWASQPDPFRRYIDTPLLALDHVEPADMPLWHEVLGLDVEPVPLDKHFISQLLYNSLAISAWKVAGGEPWALRVNPSSGNLHPGEGYVLCGPVDGLSDQAAVYHYAPREHGLEMRAGVSPELWESLTVGLPESAVLVGLSSIHWREAWKYGERAYRYCQHDAGHAIAAISLAAASLGWRSSLLDGVGDAQIASLMGLHDFGDAEPECSDCLIALYPDGECVEGWQPPADALQQFNDLAWQGRANVLSPSQVEWPIIDHVAGAASKPTGAFMPASSRDVQPKFEPGPAVSARRIIRQRRSAVAMDGKSFMAKNDFYRLLARLLPDEACAPWQAWSFEPFVHLLLFVHRVRGVDPGLYILLRNTSSQAEMKAAFAGAFEWAKPEDVPEKLPLFRLTRGDARATARQLSCQQNIAADGCVAFAMLAEFERGLKEGAWMYPRLHWESGMIGQMLYLEAEAMGLSGTGIGCFFDDPICEMLGLERGQHQWQSLYHFTIGGAVKDARLTTLPAYPPLG